MHFFKYGEQGEVLAIVLPPRARKSSGVKDGDEYEFLEVAPGAFLLARKEVLEKGSRPQLLAKIAEKLFGEKGGQASNEIEAKTPVAASKSLAAAGRKSELEKKLEAQGFIVVDEAAAKELSHQLEMQVKKGEVIGVKGFDKKVYIAERSFYENASAKIAGAKLDKQFGVEEAAAAAKIDSLACLAVLQIMKETGDAIEKKKGVFQLVK